MDGDNKSLILEGMGHGTIVPFYSWTIGLYSHFMVYHKFSGVVMQYLYYQMEILALQGFGPLMGMCSRHFLVLLRVAIMRRMYYK